MPRSKGRTGHKWREARQWVKRTQGTCYLCGKLIDKTLKWPDPKSFSVDHVTPLSIDDSLALVRSNLKAAHLSCNQSRGNGSRQEATPNSEEW
jgi:5-methylcytosine-specific restriction endonuclease McrA